MVFLGGSSLSIVFFGSSLLKFWKHMKVEVWRMFQKRVYSPKQKVYLGQVMTSQSFKEYAEFTESLLNCEPEETSACIWPTPSSFKRELSELVRLVFFPEFISTFPPRILTSGAVIPTQFSPAELVSSSWFLNLPPWYQHLQICSRLKHAVIKKNIKYLINSLLSCFHVALVYVLLFAFCSYKI